jgi:hypothetical protein
MSFSFTCANYYLLPQTTNDAACIFQYFTVKAFELAAGFVYFTLNPLHEKDAGLYDAVYLLCFQFCFAWSGL